VVVCADGAGRRLGVDEGEDVGVAQLGGAVQRRAPLAVAQRARGAGGQQPGHHLPRRRLHRQVQRAAARDVEQVRLAARLGKQIARVAPRFALTKWSTAAVLGRQCKGTVLPALGLHSVQCTSPV